MKPLSLSIVSAAILAAASFGADAQVRQEQEQGGRNAPAANAPSQSGDSTERSGGGQGAQSGERSSQSGGGSEVRPREAQGSADRKESESGNKAGGADATKQGSAEKPGDARKQDSAEKPGDANKRDAQSQQGQDKDRKSADQQDKDSDRSKSADQQKPGDQQGRDGDRKSADQQKPGDSDRGNRQASGGKEIKPEQRTVIKETIVREKIRPVKIDVQVRVGSAIPRTVVLHPLPPTIIEVYPAYRSYKLVMVDDNTLLVIDPITWEIVDVIEV